MAFTVNYAVYGALPNGNADNAEAFNVTTQLSSLLNAPGATGVVTINNNLKGDPAPGNQKHFGARVNNHYFACLEGQTIDFNHGGGSGNEPGIIVRFATYGALPGGQESAAKAFDVTAQVQAVISQSGGKVGINNATFGADPAPNNQKHFAAVVNRNNLDYYFACVENQTIDFRYGGGTM